MKPSRNRLGWAGSRLGFGVLGLAALGAAIVLLSPTAVADQAAQAVNAARLSSVDGQVQLSQGNEVIADRAVANAPLFEGTRVATLEDGRAEIQFDDGSVARLSPNSSLTLTTLRGQGGGGETEISLEAGLGYFELRGGGQPGQDGVRIAFGDSVVTAGGFTVVRINLDNPPGELAVFSGNAHIERGSAMAVDLHGGESVVLSGADPSHYDLAESIEPDSWDAWNSDRDQMLAAAGSAKTAATQGFADSSNPAWNDLDANGNWYNVPGQGNVWSPYDASDSGWDPLRERVLDVDAAIWLRLGVGLFVGLSALSVRELELLRWLWLGLGAGDGRLRTMVGRRLLWAQRRYDARRVPPPIHPRRPPIGRGGPGPHPMLAVSRQPSGGNGGLPLRNRTGTVVIAGHPVEAFHPLSPRPQYDRTVSGYVNRGGTAAPGARPGTVASPGYASGTRPGTVASPTYSPGRSGASSGGYAPRPTSGSSQHAPAPSHPASGGYSGGGSSASHPAPSGGGGGAARSGGSSSGGGGAAHGGGGGGGGSHR